MGFGIFTLFFAPIKQSMIQFFFPRIFMDNSFLFIIYIIPDIAAWRRFQATAWLESLVGPLGISSQPSEREFISCLRNGLILCNAINKIQPGAVLKVLHLNLRLWIHALYLIKV